MRLAISASRQAGIGRVRSFFFCTKDGTRVMVGIEHRDPAKPPLWHESLRS
jgi:hypothetical protein